MRTLQPIAYIIMNVKSRKCFRSIINPSALAICIYGPSNNAKTSLALTPAYNFARYCKNGLIFVGEHQAEKVEKRLAMRMNVPVG
jgi:hypothetical protein